MEARFVLRNLIACALLISSLNLPLAVAQQFGPQQGHGQYQASSQNFTVSAADPTLAKKVADEAERFRQELAVQWLGKELEPWSEKCPITVEIGMHAGGETSFAFVTDQTGRGTPVSWQMKIFGPPDRLLDAVLPHEVTHTIFATHFGRPLPRWADEGACTTVEHESERKKNHGMLLDFLTAQPSRGIPFNRMFTMRNYPHDILPLYAQGYSLAKFLIMKKGRRYFLDYVAAGMHSESQGHVLRMWDQATEKYYGYDNLSDLQVAWLAWVRNGSVELPDEQIASVIETPTPEFRAAPAPSTYTASVDTTASAATNSLHNSTDNSWYARQMEQSDARVAANRKPLENLPTQLPERTDVRIDRPAVPAKLSSPTIWR